MKKKIISLLLLATLSLTMVACGSSESTDESSSETTEETTTEESADVTYTVGVCQLVQHDALDLATEGFCDALEDILGDAVTIDVQNASGDSATCSTIVNTFVSSDYDLIMANATAALQAASQATDTIPVVATSITDYGTALDIDDWTGTTGINVTGTSDLAPLADQAAMIQELFPDAETVGILYCSAEPNSIYQANVVTEELEALGYTVTSYTFADTNDIATVTTTACEASDVLYIPTDNTAASCTETINSVALAAGVPIVAGEEGICEGCGVATLSISYYDIGYTAGEMAAEILTEGTDPATMEIQYASEFTKEYNASIVETLGITIPDDYVAIETSEE